MSSFDITTLLGIPELATYLEQVEKGLARVTLADNPFLTKPISRLMLSQGKRLRPILVIAVAASHGVKINKAVINGCIAIELLHIASLIHDDIIDDANSRWTIPTINSQEGVNQAILVGDYLLARGLEQAASVNQDVAHILATAFAAMCDGQSRELADTYNIERSEASLLKAINGKTAALISAACEMGGTYAHVNDTESHALAHYGENFGMAFQLIDDVLDFVSTPKLSGKSVGNDVKEGVYTMPLLLALRSPDGEELKAELQSAKISHAKLTDILLQTGSIEKTIDSTKKYNHSAAKALKIFNENDIVTRLSKLPDLYMRWALKNQVATKYQPALYNLTDKT